MNIVEIIQNGVVQAVKDLYGGDISPGQITMNSTRKEFEGDYTVVVFPFSKIAGKGPEVIGAEIGRYLVDKVEQIDRYNVVKGFLNLVVSDKYWLDFLSAAHADPHFGRQPSSGKKVLVEFSSPNTNKPLHLGHIRNILLGWSTYKILQAVGHEVFRVQIVNDRGIAICKSMLAWDKFAEGATPESIGIKSDHFVGDYYVLFEQKFQEEYRQWQQTEAGKAQFHANRQNGQSEEEFFKAFKNTYFNEHSNLGMQAKEMLLRWEAGDQPTLELWNRMNEWVYAGFSKTYEDLGVTFDKLYFESDTYLLGKDLVEQGLKQGVFYKKDDGSVWIDLTEANLDHKLVLRSDGTSVYITQDLGTAHLRYKDFGVDKMVYVVADEQNYHFQVLFEILKRLGEPYAGGLYHLSYGMVDLPTGKMKSREGTVVDADDLIAEVIEEARRNASERGEVMNFPPEKQSDIIRKIALAALKFHIIKVHPQKRMVFDPKESVDLQGHTGPYIQYSYVRINGIGKRAGLEGLDAIDTGGYVSLQPIEREMIQQVSQFPDVVLAAAAEYDPSQVANYCYTLAKSYSKFWHDLPIFDAELPAKKFRLFLSATVGKVLKTGMDLLGIDMPEKM